MPSVTPDPEANEWFSRHFLSPTTAHEQARGAAVPALRAWDRGLHRPHLRGPRDAEQPTQVFHVLTLHPRHHICLRSCLDLLLKAAALSDRLSGLHRVERGVRHRRGFFDQSHEKILISASASVFPFKHGNTIPALCPPSNSLYC